MRLFGCGTRRELPQAWLIGMLLPVCSLGVIPVTREMRRAGVSPGAILAFALTAPLFNPLSMLYGLTLSKPSVILGFAFASMVIVTLVGAALNRLFPGMAYVEPAPLSVAHGLLRMASIAVVAAREVPGPSLGSILVGLAGVGLLGGALPPGSLQSAMEHTNPYAPLAMTCVAIPAYASPMTAMAQLGSMFQHANSVGAAFVLFVLLSLGAGVNLGLIAWVLRNYGVGRGLAWLEQPAGPPDRAPGWLDLSIPAPALGGVALLGLIALSVVGCYAFYPAAAEVFEELAILKAEVLTAATSSDRKHVAHFVPIWDDWTRRLQVGAFLREWSLSPYRRMKAKVFRDRLELLKHTVEEGDRDYVAQVSRAYTAAITIRPPSPAPILRRPGHQRCRTAGLPRTRRRPRPDPQCGRSTATPCC
jgi:hypothetical protein